MNERSEWTENNSEKPKKIKENSLLNDDDLSTLSAWDRLMQKCQSLSITTRCAALAAIAGILVIAVLGLVKSNQMTHQSDSTVLVEPPCETWYADDGWDEYDEYEKGRNGAYVQYWDDGTYSIVIGADGTFWDYYYDERGTFLYRRGSMQEVPYSLGPWQSVSSTTPECKARKIILENTVYEVSNITLGIQFESDLLRSDDLFTVYGVTRDGEPPKRLTDFSLSDSDLWDGVYYEGLEFEPVDLQGLYILPARYELYSELDSMHVSIPYMNTVSYNYEY